MAVTSYYDVLGVEPDAGHEELRRAYVARAMTFHPDRVVPGDDEAAATAEHRMREVNEAWEVLRDSERRAAYDRDVLGRAGVAPYGRAQTPPSSTPAAVPGRRTAVVVDDGSFAAPRPGGPWWWLGPALVLGLVVVGAVVVAVLQASQEADPPVELRTGDRYEPGMCVAVRPGPTVEVVGCDGTVSGRIVEVRPFPRMCSNGDLESVVLAAEATTLCLEPVG